MERHRRHSARRTGLTRRALATTVAVTGLLATLFVGVGSSPPAAATTGPSLSDLQSVHAMLVNEETHGWDSGYQGLAINWNSTGMNYNGSGQPDPSLTTRHEDRMTTLRFLLALLLYKAKTGTTEFDGEIAFIENHVLILFGMVQPPPGSPVPFGVPTDKRGWAYTDMAGVAWLSGDGRFATIANDMVADYAEGIDGTSSPDWQFEEASALVQSGVPSYVAIGQSDLNSLWQADFLPDVNLINESPIKTSDEGDIAIALARAGMTDRANAILQGLQVFWDAKLGGYSEGGTYSAGKVTPQTKKTSGRMLNMLELGTLLGNQQLVTTMNYLFHTYIYQSKPTGYEGVLYEQKPNWSLYVINGSTENWVTSEAMGISMIALLEQ
jgi:hypothetical protein